MADQSTCDGFAFHLAFNGTESNVVNVSSLRYVLVARQSGRESHRSLTRCFGRLRCSVEDSSRKLKTVFILPKPCSLSSSCVAFFPKSCSSFCHERSPTLDIVDGFGFGFVSENLQLRLLPLSMLLKTLLEFADLPSLIIYCCKKLSDQRLVAMWRHACEKVNCVRYRRSR